MAIFREQPFISPCEQTHQIYFNSYMRLQGGTTAIHRISKKKLNSFSICKYAKTVNFCSSYALVDGSLESRTPC